MKKHLQIHSIEYGTDEWYEFRKRGIGGSEAGTVLNVNKYDTAVRLFHEKIGALEPRKDDNQYMFWGRTQEEVISDVWQYYDGTYDGYIENYKNQKIVRKCRRINGYITNPNYPWLFASVDRLINIEGGVNLITGEPLKEEGILECKNMSYWMSQVWQEGIPIFYLIQIHIYMIILETDYAEIAMLVDGSKLVVEKIQRDDDLAKKILSLTRQWWYDRVVPGQAAQEKRQAADIAGNTTEGQKYQHVIDQLEPEPDQSEAYKEYMEETFLKEREMIEGTMETYSLAKRYEVMRAMKNKIDKAMTGIKNHLIKFLRDNGAETIDFGKLGSVSWSERKGSKNRTFGCRLKEKPDEEVIDMEFEKIDQHCY